MPATGGTKIVGSAAAQSVATRALHASDAAAPTMHNPAPGALGNVPMSDGTKWVSTPIPAVAAALALAVIFEGDVVTNEGEIVWLI